MKRNRKKEKDNGEKNPYVINFVFKSGFEYDKIKTKTDSLISSEEVLILQFDIFLFTILLYFKLS